MTFGEVLHAGAQKLDKAGIEDALICAKLLLCAAANIDKAGLIGREREPIPDDTNNRFQNYVDARMAGKPVGRIVQKKQFFDCEFEVNEHVLEPRADSEILVECVVEHFNACKKPLRFIDMGTGSGALAIAICRALSNVTGVALDVSCEALEVANRNVKRCKLEDRLSLFRSNWLEKVDERVDFLVSNPPYIASDTIQHLAKEVREHDPLVALDGGEDGLDCYRAIFSQAKQNICEGGLMFLEIGYDQAQSVRTLGAKAGWKLQRKVLDLGGNDRVLIFNVPSAAS